MKNSIDILNREELIYNSSVKNKILRSATIELTTFCNWNCVHCYMNEHNSKGLDKKKVFDLFIQLRKLGTYEITLTGGEIFLRDDIFEIIENACNMHFKINIFSNISLLNRELIKKLSKYNISTYSCTIFSLDKKIHDKITNTNGSLEKVLENLEIMKEYNFPIEIKNCITSINYKEYKKIYMYCKEKGFKFRFDTEIVPQQNSNKIKNDYRLGNKELEEILLELDYLNKIKFKPHDEDEYLCPDIRNSISIDCEGNVKPCIKFQFSIGNINNRSIKDIWNNSSELNNLQNKKWKDLNKCINCKNNKYCFQCPIMNILENKMKSNNNIACEQANIRAKLYKN